MSSRKPSINFVAIVSGTVFALAAPIAVSKPALAAAATNLICTGCVGSTDIADGSIRGKDLGPGAKPGGAEYTSNGISTLFTTVPTTLTSGANITLTLPTGGQVVVTFTGYVRIDLAGGDSECFIVKDPAVSTGAPRIRFSGGAVGDRFPISSTRAFAETAAGDVTYHVACKQNGAANSMSIFDGNLTAIFVPRRF